MAGKSVTVEILIGKPLEYKQDQGQGPEGHLGREWQNCSCECLWTWKKAKNMFGHVEQEHGPFRRPDWLV